MRMAPSKAEQAYTILQEHILNGSFGPGHRLVIDQLTRDFGITRPRLHEILTARARGDGHPVLTGIEVMAPTQF